MHGHGRVGLQEPEPPDRAGVGEPHRLRSVRGRHVEPPRAPREEVRGHGRIGVGRRVDDEPPDVERGVADADDELPSPFRRVAGRAGEREHRAPVGRGLANEAAGAVRVVRPESVAVEGRARRGRGLGDDGDLHRVVEERVRSEGDEGVRVAGERGARNRDRMRVRADGPSHTDAAWLVELVCRDGLDARIGLRKERPVGGVPRVVVREAEGRVAVRWVDEGADQLRAARGRVGEVLRARGDARVARRGAPARRAVAGPAGCDQPRDRERCQHRPLPHLVKASTGPRARCVPRDDRRGAAGQPAEYAWT